jgi:hypothetical protein
VWRCVAWCLVRCLGASCVPPSCAGIGNTQHIIQYMIQLIRIIHHTGGWILYYFVLFGLQPELEPEAAAAVCYHYHYQCPHVRVGLCGMWYIYVC